MLNLMEPCLLHTSWCHLAVTPHSWCQGRASTEVNEGRSITDIKFDCRWSERSKAFDAYCHTDLITMHPHEIYEQFPQSQKQWHDTRLLFIANKLVMTAGTVPGHPHHTVLVDEFSEQYKCMESEMPTVYPAPKALVCMASLREDAENEVYIKQQKSEAEQREWKHKRRQLHAAACHQAASIRRHNLVKNIHIHSSGPSKPGQSLHDFIHLAVHGELTPDRNLFTGEKQRISRRSHVRAAYPSRSQISGLKTSDKTCRSMQTGPTTIVDPPTPPPPSQEDDNVPCLLYKGVPMPIHPEVMDMVPKVNYWKFDFVAGNCRMVPVECPINTPKGSSHSVKARRSVTNAIKKRISVKYRSKNVMREENVSFSVTKSHSKLIHYFTTEYLIKGSSGLPVYEELDDNSDTDEEYEQRVMQNYAAKNLDYEALMGDHITAKMRMQYRSRKEMNSTNGTGQKCHCNSKTPKKRVKVKNAISRVINVSSPEVQLPAMQPIVLIRREQLSPDVDLVKKVVHLRKRRYLQHQCGHGSNDCCEHGATGTN